MKKVLFVVTKSNFGGAQRYVFDLATHLPSEFEPNVAFGPAPDGTPGALAKRLSAHHVRTTLIPELARDVGFGDVHAFFALYRLLRRERPNIVHLNSSKAGGLGALSARLARVPRIIFTVHGLPSDEPRSAVQKTFIVVATWLTCFFAHTTIALTNDNLARLRRLPFLYSKVKLIHSGIIPTEYLSRADAQRALRAIDPTIPDNAVGVVAELTRNKDVALAIEAVAQTDKHLVIIGDGEERAQLETRAREKLASRAHFLGYVPDAAQYLRAFFALILTSRKEGLPYVLLEAAHAHVPIIASDIPGVRDIVLHNFTGILSARTPEVFAAGLRSLENVALAESLTAEMGRRVLTSFSFEHMIKATATLYME